MNSYKTCGFLEITDKTARTAFLYKMICLPRARRSYPLSEVAEAFRHFEEDHPSGKVVITVEQDSQGGDD